MQGKPLKYSAIIAEWYYDQLLKAVSVMEKATRHEVLGEYEPDEVAMDALAIDINGVINSLVKRFDKYFRQYGAELAEKFLKKQLRFTRSSVKASIKPLEPEKASLAIKGSIINKSNYNTVKMAITENVNLIKSIPAQYFKDIVGAVTRSMEFGGSLEQLEKDVEYIGGVAKRRARLIATDQTRKVYESLALRQLIDAGFNKVQWHHSGGGKIPREYHLRKWDGVSDNPPNGLNGYIFNINEPPIIQFAKGKQPEVRGYPSVLINCRCFLTPIRG